MDSTEGRPSRRFPSTQSPLLPNWRPMRRCELKRALKGRVSVAFPPIGDSSLPNRPHPPRAPCRASEIAEYCMPGASMRDRAARDLVESTTPAARAGAASPPVSRRAWQGSRARVRRPDKQPELAQPHLIRAQRPHRLNEGLGCVAHQDEFYRRPHGSNQVHEGLRSGPLPPRSPSLAGVTPSPSSVARPAHATSLHRPRATPGPPGRRPCYR